MACPARSGRGSEGWHGLSKQPLEVRRRLPTSTHSSAFVPCPARVVRINRPWRHSHKDPCTPRAHRLRCSQAVACSSRLPRTFPAIRPPWHALCDGRSARGTPPARSLRGERCREGQAPLCCFRQDEGRISHGDQISATRGSHSSQPQRPPARYVAGTHRRRACAHYGAGDENGLPSSPGPIAAGPEVSGPPPSSGG